MPDDLFLGAAEHSLHSRVRSGKDAVEPVQSHACGGSLEQPAPALLAGAHRRLGSLAFDELADLAADRRERGELFFIAFPSLAAEELADTQGFGVEDAWEEDPSMQPRIRRRRGAQEFGFGRRIE